jgi:FkbH-like protein
MIKPSISSVFGRVKKVLILDCDNTLWGGIIGEDGFDGIHMSDISPKGKAYKEVQMLILNLQKAGVLVALCSKNNFDDVDRVIKQHPDFLLKDSDIVAKKINWEDKASNIKQLSIDLNLGLDSFVFIDDSKFEIGLIEKELPEVKCFLVPNNISEYPYYFREILNIFYSSVNAKEDNRKTELYKTEEIRKNIATRFESIEEYLISLELELTITWDKDISIERIAQLTQKTNQFNLTTRRYSENDIRIMMTNSNVKIASFSLSDKYGDYGVVGVCIIKIIANKEIGNRAIIDTFLMSCRVIGRNVEFAFFQQIALKLKSENISNIEAEYVATPKNHQVKDFYPSIGFSIIKSTNENVNYTLDIKNIQKINSINFIKIKSNEYVN